MAPIRIGGIVVLTVGVILFFVGLNATDSLADQFSNFFTGSFTETTMWYLVGGAALAVGGLVMVMAGRRRLVRA